MGGGKVLCRVGLVLLAWEGGGITGAAVLPGLSGEVLHPGVEEEEVLRLRGWIREVLGFHFFLAFLGKYNVEGVVGKVVLLGLLMCFRGELLGLQFSWNR